MGVLKGWEVGEIGGNYASPNDYFTIEKRAKAEEAKKKEPREPEMQATGRGGDLIDLLSVRPHSIQPHTVFVLEDPTKRKILQIIQP